MRGFSSWGLLIMVLGTALAGCDSGEEIGLDGAAGRGGTGGSGGTGGGGGRAPDARLPDAAGGTPAYRYIAIFDDEKVPACTGTGPGADVDAVDLVRGTSVIGVGLRGSAMFTPSPPNTGSNVPCTTCGSTMSTCAHSGAMAAARAEGIQDGRSYVGATPDTGYIALNAGLLVLQIGQPNGNTPAQDIKSGDKVIVREVDKGYIASGAAEPGCLCTPEKYTVFAYVEMGNVATRIQLLASRYINAADNMMDCGATPTGNLGCGSTEFTVP